MHATLPPGSEFHPGGLTTSTFKPSAGCASSAKVLVLILLLKFKNFQLSCFYKAAIKLGEFLVIIYQDGT